MNTKWHIVHAPAAHHDNQSRVTTRKVELIERVLLIAGGSRERMRAELEIVTHIAGARVRVLFSQTGNANEWHARAEAARLWAQLADTRGDFEQTGDEPLQVELDHDALDRREVTVTGPDALTCVACFFGDDVAEALL